MNRHPQALKFLMPGWFSVVMGVAGLALAWWQAAPVLEDAATGISLVLGGVAAAVFGLLLVLSVVRWQRYPQALAEDLRHPVRHAFVAALPVAGLLLAAWATALGLDGVWLQGCWWVASLGQVWATVWTLQRWLVATPSAPASAATAGGLGAQGLVGGAMPSAKPVSASGAGAFWPTVTPVLLIPVVGNVVAPLAGLKLGMGHWAMAQFGMGVLLWPVVLALLLVRRAAQGPLPERLMPTWFITIAPPSVMGLVLAQVQAPLPVVLAFWGMAVFFALWVGSVARHVVAQPFSLTFWALSFPLTALASLTLKVAVLSGSGGLQTAGTVLLALASLVIAGLCLGTYKGLRDGTLLAPEPVAAIVPVNS